MFFLALVLFAVVSGITGITELGFIAVFASVPFVFLLCEKVGTRRVFAVFALLDTFTLYPLLLFQSSQGTWTLPAYAALLLITGWLATGLPLPDPLLPLKGLWARRLLASGSLLGLMALPFLEFIPVLTEVRSLIVLIMPSLLVLSAGLLYLSPLWEVLVYGWKQK